MRFYRTATETIILRTVLVAVFVAAVVIPQISLLAGTHSPTPARLQNPALPAVASAFSSNLYHHTNRDPAPLNPYPCQPKRIHLAQGDNVNAKDNSVFVTVSFSLDFAHCHGAIPSIQYGRGYFSNGSALGGNPRQFNYTSSGYNYNGTFQSDYIYHVELASLKASQTEYWYQISVVDDSAATTNLTATTMRSLRSSSRMLGESRVYTFRTPPSPGEPTSLALVGDLGQTYNSSKTMWHIDKAATLTKVNRHPVSQLLIAGDMSYADSNPNRWTSWFDLMEPLLRTTLTHVAAGNHEIECDTSTNEIFVQYENYFSNPNRIQEADMRPITDEYRKTLWHQSCSAPSEFQGHYHYGNSFYAYQHGLVHVIVLNSYTNTSAGSVQYEWFHAELQRVDRRVTPWLLVSFHAPIYTTFLGHNNESEAMNMKLHMEPLFVEYGVNVIVTGHDHAFSQSYPLAFGQVDETGKAPIYLALGAGGNHEGHAKAFLHNETQEAWVHRRTLRDFGYGHLWIPNATHALFRWVPDGVEPDDMEDHVWIQNAHI